MDGSLYTEGRYQKEVPFLFFLSKFKTAPFFSFFTVKKSKQFLLYLQRKTYTPKVNFFSSSRDECKKLTHVQTHLGDCPEQSVKFCELSDSRQQLLMWYILAMCISCICKNSALNAGLSIKMPQESIFGILISS